MDIDQIRETQRTLIRTARNESKKLVLITETNRSRRISHQAVFGQGSGSHQKKTPQYAATVGCGPRVTAMPDHDSGKPNIIDNLICKPPKGHVFIVMAAQDSHYDLFMRTLLKRGLDMGLRVLQVVTEARNRGL
jgi:hypothetical protein